MGHSATCAADAPMSEKVSKPDTEPRRAHVTNVPIADLTGPFFPSTQTFSVSGSTVPKADLYCEAGSPKGCLILTALRQRLALAR